MFDDSKSIFKSKTFWLNLLGTVALLANHAAPILPPQYAPIVLGVANIINRFLTKTPVTL